MRPHRNTSNLSHLESVDFRVAFEERSEQGFDFRVTLPAVARSLGRGFPDAHAQHCLSAQFHESRDASLLRFDDAKRGVFNGSY
jgi:hypothetical protein